MGEAIRVIPELGLQSGPNSQKGMSRPRTLVVNSDTACTFQLCFMMLIQDLLKFSASEESNERYSDFRGKTKARSKIFYEIRKKTISEERLEKLEYKILSTVEGIDTEGSVADIKFAISPSTIVYRYGVPSLSGC